MKTFLPGHIKAGLTPGSATWALFARLPSNGRELDGGRIRMSRRASGSHIAEIAKSASSLKNEMCQTFVAPKVHSTSHHWAGQCCQSVLLPRRALYVEHSSTLQARSGPMARSGARSGGSTGVWAKSARSLKIILRLLRTWGNVRAWDKQTFGSCSNGRTGDGWERFGLGFEGYLNPSVVHKVHPGLSRLAPRFEV